MLAMPAFSPPAFSDNSLKFGDTAVVKAGGQTHTVRLKVVNNSGADAIMWVTPPWDKKGIAEPESFFWSELNGAKKVCKASDGGKYIEDMTKCPGNANYFYKIELPAFQEKFFYIPDAGSASNQFFFHMGCTKNKDQQSWNRDYDNCVYGSFFGGTPTPISNELLGSNTLFEATWGCKKGVTCNKNPSDGTPLTNQDWIDISAVDGFTTPVSMKIESAKNCQFKKGTAWDGVEDARVLDCASCPTEDATTIFAQSDNLRSYFGDKKVLDLKTTDNKKVVNCVAPYKMLSTQYLGSAPGLTGRPMQPVPFDGTPTAHTKMNEINWYGCNGRCPDEGTVVDADCPAMGPAACLRGPVRPAVGAKVGDGTFSAAKTNYVARLKAMGMKAYTWQFDDDYGSKHCDAGGYVTVTLAPAIPGQIPWDNTVVDPKTKQATPYLWVYDKTSNSCSPSTSTTKEKGGTDNYFDCISKNGTYKIIPDHDTLKYCVPTEKGEKPSKIYNGYDACTKDLTNTKL
jgi:hypothetical protein